MKRYIFIFGLVLGTILCVNMVYMVNLCYTNPDFSGNELMGYAAMVLIFSLIFFGVRNYRNKELGGHISFGQAFKTGAFIALIGSTMYVFVWLFYYYLFVPDYLDIYTSHVLKEVPQTDTAALAAKTKEMAEFKEMYKNPIWVILFTYMEILPLGIVFSLVSALILKKK